MPANNDGSLNEGRLQRWIKRKALTNHDASQNQSDKQPQEDILTQTQDNHFASSNSNPNLQENESHSDIENNTQSISQRNSTSCTPDSTHTKSLDSSIKIPSPRLEDLNLSDIFHGGEFDAIDPLDSYNLDYSNIPKLDKAYVEGLAVWKTLQTSVEDKAKDAAPSHHVDNSEPFVADVLSISEPSQMLDQEPMTMSLYQQLTDEAHALYHPSRSEAFLYTPEVENLNPVSVEFQSNGNLLLTTELSWLLAQTDLSWLNLLAAQMTSLYLVVLNQDEIALSEVLKPLHLDSTIELISAQEIDLSGSLGAFIARIKPSSESDFISLAPAFIGQSGFDLVLDMTTKGLLPAALPALGYYPVGRGYPKLEQALEELPEMIGAFDKPKYFDLTPELCAHSVRGLEGCTRCIDACPADALSSVANDRAGFDIQINPNLCQGIGTCASACPTEAIRYIYPQAQQTQNFMRRLLGNFLAAKGHAPVVLFCSQAHQEYNQMILQMLPARVLPIELEELPSVGIDTWFEALTHGAVQVAFAASLRMPKQVRDVLEAQVAQAKALLTQLGHSEKRIDIWYMEEMRGQLPELFEETLPLRWPDTAPNAQIPSLDISPMPIDQGRKGKKQEFDFKAAAKPKPVVKPKSPKRMRLFESLDALANAAPSLQAEDAIKVYPMAQGDAFGTLSCNQDCTLCMSCVAVCPTGALKSGVNEPKLQICEQDCVQCGLCEKACPESALELVPQMNWDRNLRRGVQVLHQEEAALCLRCSKPFAPASMIKMLTEKLAGNSHFSTPEAQRRISMCEDCRVKDKMEELIADPAKQSRI